MKRDKGSVSFTLFVLALSFGMVAFAVYLMNLPARRSQTDGARPLSPDEVKITELQGELFQLYTAIDGFESMRNSAKYLEIVGQAGEKLIEADNMWEEAVKGRRGAFDGMIGGIVYAYEGRFSSAEKLEMLGKKYGVPPDKLRRLQAELEIMFSSELAEKFAPVGEEYESEPVQEESPNPNPKTKS